MAVKLNKKRMRDSRVLVVLTLLAGVFCSTWFSDATVQHQVMDFSGYFLVMICALGRVYSTAFIGGSKNVELITLGPYSLCRNPLYFFSIIGALGIGLMSSSLIATFVVTAGFIIIYKRLIAREELFLTEKFGQSFRDYRNRVPRLFPSFRQPAFPQEMTFQPKALTNAVLDAIWWFVPYPIFELAEYLQASGIIKPIMVLP